VRFSIAQARLCDTRNTRNVLHDLIGGEIYLKSLVVICSFGQEPAAYRYTSARSIGIIK
jgi:hypothetical protein